MRSYKVDKLSVEIYGNRTLMGEAAAAVGVGLAVKSALNKAKSATHPVTHALMSGRYANDVSRLSTRIDDTKQLEAFHKEQRAELVEKEMKRKEAERKKKEAEAKAKRKLKPRRRPRPPPSGQPNSGPRPRRRRRRSRSATPRRSRIRSRGRSPSSLLRRRTRTRTTPGRVATLPAAKPGSPADTRRPADQRLACR